MHGGTKRILQMIYNNSIVVDIRAMPAMRELVSNGRKTDIKFSSHISTLKVKI
jgi:hypothetical protein